MTDYIADLNARTAKERLEALAKVREQADMGLIPAPPRTPFVNNHIHTTFSFSPYSPTKALYMAWQTGLETAGIMDHDSLGGAKEFIEAGRILRMPVTCGVFLIASLALMGIPPLGGFLSKWTIGTAAAARPDRLGFSVRAAMTAETSAATANWIAAIATGSPRGAKRSQQRICPAKSSAHTITSASPRAREKPSRMLKRYSPATPSATAIQTVPG